MSTNIIRLSEWQTRLEAVARDGLMRFVLDAVQNVDWPNKGKMFRMDPVEEYASDLMMVLEVYCYARGIYESEDVVFHARSLPELAIMFEGRVPDARLIRLFRRRHREEIKQCLLEVFDIAFQVRFGRSDGDETPVDSCVAQAIDQWFEPICGPYPLVEAEERIDQAIFWDGMAASA